ncbi:hypothetical protein QDY71_06250 [Kingella negevensis]|nr:hypothetical protein [Kingella negevensis]MDK4697355.1 hypothetical protein [Kingella negevensis]MDK4708953.1 hypothetical protein [Kingella negevensis]
MRPALSYDVAFCVTPNVRTLSVPASWKLYLVENAGFSAHIKAGQPLSRDSAASAAIKDLVSYLPPDSL